VFITSFAAGPLQANTYVFAPHEGAGCAVVDPGMESFDPLKVVLEQHQLTVEAVLITHGHFDHMWSAQHVADHYGCPVWIHPKDRHLLTDPLAAVSGPSAAMLREQFLSFVPSFSEPAEVRDATAGVHIDVAGIDVRVHEASGHTPGTVVYMVDWDGPEPVSQVMFAGDFLFYGSIGRTDLTGGDHSQMMESLRREVLSLADDVVVLPGHGQQTSIGREKLTNPYLAELNA
jgi:hydroxyacylglutathione hydrolase